MKHHEKLGEILMSDARARSPVREKGVRTSLKGKKKTHSGRRTGARKERWRVGIQKGKKR